MILCVIELRRAITYLPNKETGWV